MNPSNSFNAHFGHIQSYTFSWSMTGSRERGQKKNSGGLEAAAAHEGDPDGREACYCPHLYWPTWKSNYILPDYKPIIDEPPYPRQFFEDRAKSYQKIQYSEPFHTSSLVGIRQLTSCIGSNRIQREQDRATSRISSQRASTLS